MSSSSLTKSTSTYGSATPLSYEFEIKNAAGATVCPSGLIGGGTGTTVTYTPTNCTLEFDTTHTWRVRAGVGNDRGPWSATATFKAPSGGYIRDNEVFDPLTNGRTVGEIVGPVTFIPGVGVRLEDFTSHIRYRLPRTMVTGEFSTDHHRHGDQHRGGQDQGVRDVGRALRSDHQRAPHDGREARRSRGHRRLALHLAQRPGRHRRRRARSSSSSIRTRRTCGPPPGTACSTSACSAAARRARRSTTRARATTAPTIPTRTTPSSARRSGRSGPSAATVPGMIVRNVWISQRARPAGL